MHGNYQPLNFGMPTDSLAPCPASGPILAARANGGRTTGLGDAGTSWLDSTVTLPIVGAVNPWLLAAGGALLYLILKSGEGKTYTRAKTARVRSAIHGARMAGRARSVDAAKKRLRDAERRLEALQAS